MGLLRWCDLRSSQAGMRGVGKDAPADGVRGRAADAELLVIEAEPPPATEMEIAMQALLAEFGRSRAGYRRADTADPGDTLGSRGRWTLQKTALALSHFVAAAQSSLHRDVAAVHISVAQEFPARDIAFLIVASVARRPVIIHPHRGVLHHFYEAVRVLLRRTLGRAALGIVLTERLSPALGRRRHRVILDAMAPQLPVVAPAYPGVADTDVDGETGLLVEQPTPDGVAEKLVLRALDVVARLQLGVPGGQRYEERFTQTAFGERMIQVLARFVKDGRVTASEVAAK